MGERLLLLLIVSAGVVSCANPRKITVSEPVRIEMETLSKLNVTLQVENCTAHRIKLLDGRLRLKYGNAGFATLVLREPVTVPKCSGATVVIPLRVKFDDPLAALSAAALDKADMDNLTVTGEVVLKAGMGRKKIRIKDKPVSEILTIFNRDGGIGFK